jgi:diguanylate cyclase (GGDEF)-like protein
MNIQNVDDEHVGYIFTVYEDRDYTNSIKHDAFIYPAIVVFFVILHLFVWSYAKDKRRIRDLSQTDVLTSLYNRLYFNKAADHILEHSKRYEHDLSVILMDIDHFKKVNDTFGYLMGDEMIKELAQMLMTVVRDRDVLARWGGEEFVLLLPDTSLDQAIEIAQAIKTTVAQTTFKIKDNITLSFGVSTMNENMTSIDDLLSEADRNLYRAKGLGRNRIVSNST